MKAIMIIYNQALTGRIDELLEDLGVRGFTKWENVQGQGSVNGEPRMGTHTWPELNSSTLAMVEDEKVDTVLSHVKKLDLVNETVGIRAFVWDIISAI